jgi:hypothetical protein
VVSADSYEVSVTGDGAITGNSNDIANAERARGISNVEITGFASKAAFNFDGISIKLSGGAGKDKTFTITEGSETVTQTFTVAQWNEAKAAGTVLRFSHSFGSGTRIGFDVDFDAIEDVPDTAGVGISTIEKNVNLQVVATNQNGETVTRDGLSALGSGKVSNGENAFAFDSGTARIQIDERQILSASQISDAISSVYGTGSNAFSSVSFTGNISTDEAISVSAAGGTFNYATNSFDDYTLSLDGPNAAAVTLAYNAGTGTATFGAYNGATYTVGVNDADLKLLATADAADAAETNGTKTSSGLVNAVAGDFSVTDDPTGFADNAVSNLQITLGGTVAATTFTLSDGVGGTATAAAPVNQTGAASQVTFTISGGVNDGATFTLDVAGGSLATGTDAVSGTLNFNVRGEFTSNRTASFDVRADQTGQSATLTTQQLVDGSDANNMTVQLNETNTSTVTVVSQNVQTDGQGLQLDFAQNSWNDRADIENSIRQLDAAKLKLRSASSALSTNSNTLLTRLDFTAAVSDVLKEGAGKLTLADQNEEGANILTLQTRQQLGTISLSLANQAQQAILRLF